MSDELKVQSTECWVLSEEKYKLLLGDRVDNGEIVAEVVGGKAGERHRCCRHCRQEAGEAPPGWREIGGNGRVIRRCAHSATFAILRRVQGSDPPCVERHFGEFRHTDTQMVQSILRIFYKF